MDSNTPPTLQSQPGYRSRTEEPAHAYPAQNAHPQQPGTATPELALTPSLNVSDASLFINRELSTLEFNRRVLEQARDPVTPLLERLKFLCISCSNLDEFFEIRVSGIIEQVKFGASSTGPDGLTPTETLNRISEIAHQLVAEQYRVLNEELFPALAEKGIEFLPRDRWTTGQEAWIDRYFHDQVLPIITPIRLDPAHPFPPVSNKNLHFVVQIEGEDAYGQQGGMAVVQAPRVFPRLIRLPGDLVEKPDSFVFLSSVIHANLDQLFPGMNVTGCFQFRVTRNSDLFVDEEEVDDLLRALEGELPSRRYGTAVRLEVADNSPEQVVRFLLKQFELTERDVYRVNGPVNLIRLMGLPDEVSRPDLKYPAFTPSLPARLTTSANPFEVIKRGDLLLHHPFESFAPVADLVRRAAADPDVLAIKQTLYRTGAGSTIVEALHEAAMAGKEVTVVIELRARFEEEANISLASRLQEAGAHVVYGVVGYKTHAKMLMIVRREADGLRRYIHLGTGNYHAKTARLYTDYSLFTADPGIGEDVHRIFMQLTSLGRATALGKLLQAPFTLLPRLISLIEQEAENARQGRPARIVAKMNAIIERKIIEALYNASAAGVSIDLIVRGVCALRPGIKGVSENIRVRSIVGRFLEHTRIFYFENAGDPLLYGASADWMDRNLYRRVETCFPIEDPTLKLRVIDELMTYLRDNMHAWELGADGTYIKVVPANDDAPLSAQSWLLDRIAEQPLPGGSTT